MPVEYITDARYFLALAASMSNKGWDETQQPGSDFEQSPTERYNTALKEMVRNSLTRKDNR